MKVIYTLTTSNPKEKWSCQFCNSNDAPYVLSTGSLETNKLLAVNHLCNNCKTKWENNEVGKCPECERPTKSTSSQCMCKWLEERGETLDSSDSDDDYDYIQKEKQISELTSEKKQLETDVEIAISALGVAEKWDSRKELVDENTKLRKRIEKLEANLRSRDEENISLKIEVSGLKTEVLQLGTKIEQYETKIEVPPKK